MYNRIAPLNPPHLMMHGFPREVRQRGRPAGQRQAPYPAQEHPEGHGRLKRGEAEQGEPVPEACPGGSDERKEEEEGSEADGRDSAPLEAEHLGPGKAEGARDDDGDR